MNIPELLDSIAIQIIELKRMIDKQVATDDIILDCCDDIESDLVKIRKRVLEGLA